MENKALEMHRQWNGKLETVAKSKVKSREDLAIAYTPGVAEPCKVIAKDPEAAYTYTMKANTVAVVSDGSAVLGLGNIGAYAAMPVMEGKCVLFKEFGNVNAVPICLDTQDTEEIIATVKNIAPAFGGINLEDISAPRCFEIEERLKKMLDIPVFHDDQHGTAIVVLAGIINALKVTGKKKEDCRVVVNGAGSAGAGAPAAGAVSGGAAGQGYGGIAAADQRRGTGPRHSLSPAPCGQGLLRPHCRLPDGGGLPGVCGRHDPGERPGMPAGGAGDPVRRAGGQRGPGHPAGGEVPPGEADAGGPGKAGPLSEAGPHGQFATRSGSGTGHIPIFDGG